MNQALPQGVNGSGSGQSKPQVKAIATSVSESFSGPIPPPNILAGYEKILPGLADRIMKMAESQSEHRKQLEGKVILHDRVKSILGLIFAFVIVVIAIAAGVYLALQGKAISGGVLGLVPLATIVGAFIYQQRESKKE